MSDFHDHEPWSGAGEDREHGEEHAADSCCGSTDALDLGQPLDVGTALGLGSGAELDSALLIESIDISDGTGEERADAAPSRLVSSSQYDAMLTIAIAGTDDLDAHLVDQLDAHEAIECELALVPERPPYAELFDIAYADDDGIDALDLLAQRSGAWIDLAILGDGDPAADTAISGLGLVDEVLARSPSAAAVGGAAGLWDVLLRSEDADSIEIARVALLLLGDGTSQS